MKSLIFKPTMLVMVMVCLMYSYQGNSINDNQNNNFFLGGGHIEVVGDFLTGDTGDPSIVIEEVVLSGAVNYELTGCNKMTCTYDISNVANGTYEATLLGSGGYIYTKAIVVR